MFEPKRSADGHLEEHKSKVFVVVEPETDTVSITMECETCGRVELPPIPVTHVHTLEQVAKDISDRIGLTDALKRSSMEEVGGFIEGQSLDEARASFDAKSVDELTSHPNATPTGSAWEA